LDLAHVNTMPFAPTPPVPVTAATAGPVVGTSVPPALATVPPTDTFNYKALPTLPSSGHASFYKMVQYSKKP
jgi:hypothetical protein